MSLKADFQTVAKTKSLYRDAVSILDAELHEAYDPGTEFMDSVITLGSVPFAQRHLINSDNGSPLPDETNLSLDMGSNVPAPGRQNATGRGPAPLSILPPVSESKDADLRAEPPGISGNRSGGIGIEDLNSGGGSGAGGGDSAPIIRSGDTPSANSSSSSTTIINNPPGPPGLTPATPLIAPDVSVSATPALENQPVNLTITATLDPDPSVVTIFTISGLPAGATLSAGTQNPNGTWTLTLSDLTGLQLIPAPGSSGNFNIIVTATSTRGPDTASDSEIEPISIEGVATPPTLSVTNITGNEDTPIALNISSALVDNDGSETLSISIFGVPAGATLSAGTNLGGGVWSLTPAQLTGLTLTPALNMSGPINLTVTATSTENASTASTSSPMTVTISGVADTPLLATQAVTGAEDTAIALTISAALTDTDGSETLSITIGNIPAGAVLSAGINNGNGTWTLTPLQLTGLTFTPPADWSGIINLSVTATASENGTQSSSSLPLTVTVTGSADAPALTALDVTGNEDTAIALNISAMLADSSESLSISLSGVPAGATLSAGTNAGGGVWTLTPAQLTNLTLTPPQHWSGVISLTATATATDGSSTAIVSDPFNVTVNGVADAPTLATQPASGAEDTPIALQITSSLVDADGSETLSILIGNIPAGSLLSAGINNGNGTWTLTPAQLAGLTITPPQHLSGLISLSVMAISTENGSSATTSGTLALSITGSSSSPSLSVQPATGTEDNNVPLNITASLNDVDGSEILTIVIGNLPPGATLSAGVNNGDGTWTLADTDLPGLQLIPALNWSGTIALSVTAVSTEGADVSSTTSPLALNITGIADTPLLNAQDFIGAEDSAISLNISSALTDTDGSETLTILIANVPAGSALSAGINNGNGTWTLTGAQLAGLTLTPPSGYSGTLTLNVIATASEDGTSAIANDSFDITVNGVADTPNLTTQPASGIEDTPISLQISSSLGDTDGSETLSILISNVPAGATLSAGINNGNGIWTLTPAQLAGLTITPPFNSDADFVLSVTATATESGGGTSQLVQLLPVTVAGAADLPSLLVNNVAGNEDTAIALNISAALTDTDGSETLSVTIGNVPAGATLSAGTNNGNGTWTLTPAQLAGLTLTPPAHWSGTINLTISATATEGATSSTASSGMTVSVNGVATPPTVSADPASGPEDTAIPLDIEATLVDTDGSETLSIIIGNVPAGASLSAGINNGNGTWTLTAAQLTNLSITPPSQFNGVINLTVTATSSENATTASVSTALPVTVTGEADTPTLSVSATATGSEDTAIPLTISAALTDIDGSEQLSILISGVPAGAVLSAGLYAGNGKWSLSPSDLAGLTLTPPQNFSGAIALQVSAIATENDGDRTIVTSPCTVSVLPVADTPILAANAITAHEDTPFALSISSSLFDTDGSETLSIIISGVPAGVNLSAGVNNGNGSWTLLPAQLAGLMLTLPANSDADFTLTVTALATEAGGGSAQATQTIPVTVLAIADVPTVTANNTSGAKNTQVNVTIGGAVTDTDGSETITYIIDGVPDGFALNHGINNGDNSWILTPAQLAGLKLISPLNFEGRVHLTAMSVAHDHDGSVTTSNPLSFNVGIGNASGGIQINLGLGIGIGGIGLGVGVGIGVNLGGLLDPGGIVIMEDSIMPLPDANLLLTLASNISFLTISGLPVGASLSAGVDLGGGVWQLLPGQLNGLNLIAPPNSDEDFTLTISARILGIITIGLATTLVHVVGVADMPTLSVTNASGVEDGGAIHINVTSALTDTDGSETLSFLLKDLPPGFTPNVGINNGDGSWSIAASAIPTLAITPPANFSGDVTYTLIAISTEREGDSTIHSVTGHIHISPVTDTPFISADAVTGQEDAPLNLGLDVFPTDSDGSEEISAITISGLPAGFGLSHAIDNGNGTWSVDPDHIDQVNLIIPSHWSGDLTLNISATSRETAGGVTSSTSTPLSIHIEGIADAPSCSAADATGDAGSAISLNLTAALTDTDGSESLSIVISGMTGDSILSAGLNNGDGTWTLTQAELAGLTFTSSESFSGDLNLNMTAFSIEDNGSTASHSDQFTIHVDPA